MEIILITMIAQEFWMHTYITLELKPTVRFAFLYLVTPTEAAIYSLKPLTEYPNQGITVTTLDISCLFLEGKHRTDHLTQNKV